MFEYSHGHYTHPKELVAGTTVCVVMLLIHLLSSVSFDFSSKICALLEWLALKTTCPAGMEVSVPRAQVEVEAGTQAPRPARGCTSNPWPKEPGQWPYTTPYLSNRTVSQSTGLCSSSVRIISYGNMPKRLPNGHILTVCPTGDHWRCCLVLRHCVRLVF